MDLDEPDTDLSVNDGGSCNEKDFQTTSNETEDSSNTVNDGRSCDDTEEPSNTLTEDEEYLGGPVFEPPLYMQRYYFVEQQLEKYNVKHVVDFGSAECKISRFLVQIRSLQRIDLVDLDRNLLERCKHAIRPFTSDYLDKRDVPLHVRMLHGSVTDLDSKVLGCDAVSMVEIIEHLNPDILEGAVTMVFGELQPRVVIMTTPNSEFNQLFPNFTGMRHWDHKFEWTRQEMKQWCDDICECYPYTVEYGGIGEPPVDNQDLGHCSQYAIFVRDLTVTKKDVSIEAKETYKLIFETFYPYKENILSDEDIILRELKYLTRQCQNAGFSYHGDDAGNQGCDFIMGNQSVEQVPECHRLVCSISNNVVYESDVDTGIQSVFHYGEGSSETDGNRLQYCLHCSKTRMENMCRQFIPVKCLMSRTIQKKLNFEQFQTFLQNHGYHLSDDSLYVVVDCDTDYDKDSSFDDNFDADEILADIENCCDFTETVAEFSLEDALSTDQWEIEDG